MNLHTQAELARWQFLREALSHCPDARKVCHSRIAELLDVEGDDTHVSSETLESDLRAIKDAAADRIREDIELNRHNHDVAIEVASGQLSQIVVVSSELNEANDRIAGLENALRATLDIIEAYADDHNAPLGSSTDVTVILPLLRKWVGTSAQTDLFAAPQVDWLQDEADRMSRELESLARARSVNPDDYDSDDPKHGWRE